MDDSDVSHHDQLANHFELALELSKADRRRYLTQLGVRDQQMAGDLEALLNSSEQAKNLFVSTDGVTKLNAIRQRLSMPDTIGAYEVVDILGDGGMAVVYLARQLSPMREVAIKMIKLGMDTQQVLARFELERDVLALMSHPNIARIYDAGVSQSGKPYFVMEHVDGLPITSYSEENHLTLNQRIGLLIQVCDAVAHAHRKGQIHRDLKPSNILVSQQDQRHTPKVIDFGVVKSLGIRPNSPITTQLGQVIGTPAYMSPEQAGASPHDLDTRTDIFSLGVVLCELMTGQLPEFQISDDLSPNTLKAGMTTQNPASTIYNQYEHRLEFAQNCQMEPAAITKKLRDDLDWIILKAISYDRELRYSTVKEFAQDLKAHLSGAAVEARPPSRFYYFQRLIKRNKTMTALTASLAIVILSSAVALIKGTHQARESQRVAVMAQQEAAHQHQLALRESARVSTVTEFLVELFEVSDPNGAAGAQVSARELLDRGVRDLDESLIDQPVIRASMYDAIARVYANMGLYDSAQSLATRALDLIEPHSQTDPTSYAQALRTRGLIYYYQGEYIEAEKIHRLALSITQKDPITHELTEAEHLHNLATSVFEQGRNQEAQDYFVQALELRENHLPQSQIKTAESLNSLASVKRRLGKLQEAHELYQRALNLRIESGQVDHPDLAITLSNLGVTLFNIGDYNTAEEYLRRALDMQQSTLESSHPQIGTVLSNLGATLVAQGELPEAHQILSQSEAWHRQSYGSDHPNTANALLNLGTLLHRTGGYSQSMALFNESIEILSSEQTRQLPTFGIAQANLASTLVEMDKSAEALVYARRSVKNLRQSLPMDHPWIAVAESILGTALGLEGDQRESKELIEKSLPIIERAFGEGNFRTIEAHRRLQWLKDCCVE